MALSEYKQGTVIYSEGDPIQNLSFITKGSAEFSFNGQPFRFEKGDVIGLCDLSAGVYSHTYMAAADVTVFLFPYESFDALDTLLRDNADVANRLVISMCRQISEFLQFRFEYRQEADNAYKLINEIYAEYERLCKSYAVTSKKLPGLSEIAQPSEDDPVEDWVHNYYMEINKLDPAILKALFYKNVGISLGFLHISTDNILQVLQSCRIYHEYLEKLSTLFLDSGGHDLFALVSELHLSSINIKGADATVEAMMLKLAKLLSGMTGVNFVYYKKRLTAYKEQLTARRGSQQLTDAPVATGLKQNLTDSLPIILEYSGCPEEQCNKFVHFVHDFTKASDRGSSDDDARKLRKELTAAFYEIYLNVFIKSLEDPAVPTIIKMFLNFGYVDAKLAGIENADYLYSIADSLKGDQTLGVYTLTEWFQAIYRGEKEPSKNEFDEDYAAVIHEKKVTNKITAEEEKRLLADLEGKLRFEIEQVFPIVNKMTFGIISTFCPLFGDHNVQRSLDISLVTPDILKNQLDEIRSVDFSAYYRPTMFSNPDVGVPKETVNLEVLPDIILMPNVGIRGAMWQDIEGRKRNTPSRMFMPLFLQSDLKVLMTRLTGEFRWEMCKRIQGSRWNDMTEPSLTSEYCDYLQFYKSNRDLSQEVKETIKLELVRAKNNYKAVFVSNYSDWLGYEAKGSPRLNKNARRMMISYCPFPAELREKMKQNPQHAELLNRYNFKQQQRIKHVSNVVQKITQSGKAVPQELLGELEFTKM